ncbi:MAG: hypothetical protein U9P38_03980 [Campylobacterota bacterium]|nr:hypothetical protein [Campylobacterota bacterium]
MKINISRQIIYLLGLTLFLLIFVSVFSFNFLIPEGKEYRKVSAEVKKERRILREYQNYNDAKLEEIAALQTENKAIIKAFDTPFNTKKFEKQYKKYFSQLSIAPQVELAKEREFKVYEVNTTSQINSPKSFYNFLEGINKSEWMISINFPINFKRNKQGISASFTMKVYKIDKKKKKIEEEENSKNLKKEIFDE